jgi:hypothetical protein
MFFALPEVSQNINLIDWFDAIKALPRNRKSKNINEQSINSSVHSGFALFASSKEKQWEMLQNEVDKFIARKNKELNHSEKWHPSNEGKTVPTFIHKATSSHDFAPFAQKIVAKKGEEIIFRGDLHGDALSLITQLKDMHKSSKIDANFKLAPGNKMIFLGDYTDRGKYGSEVWYTLLRLANANPENVVLVRGNHEDCQITSRYGFEKELNHKFAQNSIKAAAQYDKINAIHKYLPVVAYVGNKKGEYLQCCHGGIEQGYRPASLLKSSAAFEQLGVLNRESSINEMMHDPRNSGYVKNAINKIKTLMRDNVKLQNPCGDDQDPALGFMWNDFNPNDNGGVPIRYKKGRGFEYGKDGVNAVLNQQNSSDQKIVAIIRGHQHSTDRHDTMMKKILQGNGVARLWNENSQKTLGNGEVLTLNVAPDSDYGEALSFDDDVSMGLHYESDGAWQHKIYKHHPFEQELSNHKNGKINEMKLFLNQNKKVIIGASAVMLAAGAVYLYKKYKKKKQE